MEPSGLDHFELEPHLLGVFGPDTADQPDTEAELLRGLIADGTASPPALMVGDRAEDLLAALANGLRLVGVLWGYGALEELLAAGARDDLASRRRRDARRRFPFVIGCA
jgi:phosphoglycolate phosphatase